MSFARIEPYKVVACYDNVEIYSGVRFSGQKYIIVQFEADKNNFCLNWNYYGEGSDLYGTRLWDYLLNLLIQGSPLIAPMHLGCSDMDLEDKYLKFLVEDNKIILYFKQ